MKAICELIGQPLLPWQEYALTEGTKVAPNGKWSHRTVGVTVARQNGKSHLMRSLILTHLFVWDSKRILSMAQNRSLALDQFKQAVDVVMAVPELRQQVKRVSRTNGQEALELKNGALWEVVAATREGSRGRSSDLLWVDELREITEEAWKASTPTTRARPNAQIWTTSNAGDAHSTVLNDLRTAALSGQDKLTAWLEWSADPKLNVMDKAGWYQANPALGHLIDENVIESAAKMDKPEAFRTESLCLWVDSMDSPWAHGSWDAAQQTDLLLDVGLPTWLAVDVSPDRRRADLVAGQSLPDGKTAVGLIQSWESNYAVDNTLIAGEVAKWARHYSVQQVAFDKWTGAEIAQRLQQVGIPTVDVSGAAFAQACDETLSALTAGRIVHAGQPDLDAHMNAAVRKPAADGGWRIVRKASAGYISAAVALVMVVHFSAKPEQKSDLIFV